MQAGRHVSCHTKIATWSIQSHPMVLTQIAKQRTTTLTARGARRVKRRSSLNRVRLASIAEAPAGPKASQARQKKGQSRVHPEVLFEFDGWTLSCSYPVETLD